MSTILLILKPTLVPFTKKITVSGSDWCLASWFKDLNFLIEVHKGQVIKGFDISILNVWRRILCTRKNPVYLLVMSIHMPQKCVRAVSVKDVMTVNGKIQARSVRAEKCSLQPTLFPNVKGCRNLKRSREKSTNIPLQWVMMNCVPGDPDDELPQLAYKVWVCQLFTHFADIPFAFKTSDFPYLFPWKSKRADWLFFFKF